MLATFLLPLLLAAPAASATPTTGLAGIAPAPGAQTVTGPVSPAVLAAAPPDVFDGVDALEGAASCGNAPLCSRQQRVKLVCDLRKALEERYVFFPTKGKMIAGPGGEPFDSRRHVDACVAEERAIAREDDPLRFFDRLRRCVAAFEDGHLLLSSPARLPQVALGFGLARIDGRLYVRNRTTALVRHVAATTGVADLDQVLAVGNEVVEIDGRPAGDVLAEVSAHVPASSEAARVEKGVDALTRRDFLFPAKRTATLVVDVHGTRRVVEVPWWISPDAKQSALARAYLARTGLPTTTLLPWRYDGARDNWDRDGSRAEGHQRTDPIVPPEEAASLRSWTDEAGRTAVRFGAVRAHDRAFCYLQIVSFHTEDLVASGVRRPFATVLQEFVGECRERKLDLVLDLRANGGGYIAHSSALAAMLARPERTSPGGALLLRATAMTEKVYLERAPATGSAPPPGDDDFEPRRVADVIGAARRAGAPFTRAFLESPLAPAGGGYGGRVVALVSPSCMSACDRTAALLRASGRAILVGGPTEGAGGSQQETRDVPVRWTDADGLASLSIPNAAMGVQASARKGAAPPSSDDFFRALAFENRPVPPDVQYATTLDDLQHHDRGWLAQAARALAGDRPEHDAPRGGPDAPLALGGRAAPASPGHVAQVAGGAK